MGAAIAALAVVACGGGAPPPKVEPPKEESRGEGGGPTPMVQQELGSIDQRAVEKKFFELEDKIEGCHQKGRDRIEYLSGDVKVFLRIDASGHVRYGYLEESTLGDRDTEKCILDVFANATWPKPQGGEAEVRNGFGWGAGGEREPASWSADKVTSALDEDKEAKKELAKCKAGHKAEFAVTAYVVHAEPEETEPAPKHGKAGGKPSKKTPKVDKDRTGRFQAVGMAAPNMEASQKIDCLVDALKHVKLPNPGSYAAKVTFML